MSAPTLQLYGMAKAPCTQIVIAAALENGADFELKLVDLYKGEQKSAEHLARQPFGKIPALDDGGFVVYESRAIARYVNETRGNKLVPSDPKARAIMEQWISLEQGTIAPEVTGIVVQRVYPTDEAKVIEHAEKLKQAFDILDAHLAKNQFVAGEQFTLVDIFFLPYLSLLLPTPEATLLTSRPNINAWWKRVTERPSWVKTLTYKDN